LEKPIVPEFNDEKFLKPEKMKEKTHQKNHTHPEKILIFHTEPYPPPSREKSSDLKSEPPPENKPREKDTFLVPMPLKKMNPKNPPNKSFSLNKKTSQIPEQMPQNPDPKKEPAHSATPIKKITPSEESASAPKHTNHHHPPHVGELTGVIPPPNSAKIPEKRKMNQTTPPPQKKAKPNVQDSGTERFIELVRRQQLQLAAQKPGDKRKQRGVKRHRD